MNAAASDYSFIKIAGALQVSVGVGLPKNHTHV